MDTWISVEDKMPEPEIPVLVYCQIYGRYITTCKKIGDTEFIEWRDFEGCAGALPPTHWMPLPPPPTDKEG